MQEYRGVSLSKFKTYNIAKKFYEIKNIDDLKKIDFGLKSLFILGNGSNVFFKNRNVKSVLLKNELPKIIEDLGNGEFEVSSSVNVIDLLNRVYKEGLDGPYYLASAPAQVGGAVAMNAGTGIKENKAISDYIEEVEYFDGKNLVRKNITELNFSYRESEFKNNRFITSVKFSFSKMEFLENPIKARLEWANKNQDLSVNNCGSICNKYDAKLMKMLGKMFYYMPAGLSKKKMNWARNSSKNPIYLKCFFATLKLLHKLCSKNLKIEIKIVD